MGTWCFTSFEKRDVTEITGSKGRITYSTFDNRPIILETGKGRVEFSIDNPPHIQQPLIQTVVDALNGIGSCHSTGKSAARTLWVMDHMLSRADS
ncbi:MAG: hypothetical protein U5R06_12820 [candidate division KSB1 bacterium]|nr:hypothetical protein [candidate division KSB1 bacterium]